MSDARLGIPILASALSEHTALLGPAAGLLTSICWTGTSIFFTAAGRRLGPTVVNASRIALAIVILGLVHRYLISDDGAWLPDLRGRQVVLLALSGLIGLSLGDQALFTAFVELGPRRSNLIMTTAPIIAALLGFLVLGERLGPLALLGMATTIGGVGWVIRERPKGRVSPTLAPPGGRRVTRGVILAFVGSACQAAGLLLSKAGMGHGWMDEADHLDPQAATFVRMMFAGLGMVPIMIVWQAHRRGAARVPVVRRGTIAGGIGFTVAGTIIGPVFGVWMSLVAADATSVGIAQTLLSLTPVLILPYAAFVEKEHVSWRAVIGAIIAVIGVAILFIEA